MANTNNTPLTPNPSTYKQVVKNLEDINSLKGLLGNLGEDAGSIAEQLAAIKEIVDALTTGMTATATGDVYGKFPDLKVLGVHASTDKAADNLPPSYYVRDITYEIKAADSIGLSGMDGVTSQYVLVSTINVSTQTGDVAKNFKPFQLAYGNSTKRFYREAAVNDAWSSWVEEQSGGGGGGNTDFITSETQPGDSVQKTGDYWMEVLNIGGEP